MKHPFLLRSLVLFTTLASTAASPAALWAQGAARADLVGYEKAGFVTGTVKVEAGGIVSVEGLKSVYNETLHLYLAEDFDASRSVRIGVLSPDMPGDMTFEVPAEAVAGKDSVMLLVPDRTVPVAVGLLRGP